MSRTSSEFPSKPVFVPKKQFGLERLESPYELMGASR